MEDCEFWFLTTHDDNLIPYPSLFSHFLAEYTQVRSFSTGLKRCSLEALNEIGSYAYGVGYNTPP